VAISGPETGKNVKERELIMLRIPRTNVSRIFCLLMVSGARDKAHENDRALALLSIEPLVDYEEHSDPNIWWLDLASALNMEFWRLCWLEDYEQHLTRLIRQFGKHGPMVDIKLCLTDPSFMPQHYDHAPRLFSAELRREKPELETIAARDRQIQNLVSKIQVDMFLEDPDLLERYYNLIIWSGQFSSASLNEWWSFVRRVVGLDEFLYTDERDPDYWWYARQFMLLAHATGRDDLLRDVDPTDLSPRCETWDNWVWTNIWEDEEWTRFFPHPHKPIWVERDSLLAEGRELIYRPALPFPDWDTKVLPPPDTLFSDFFRPSSCYFGDELPLSDHYSTCEEPAGTVSRMSDLPYIGKAVCEFPVRGTIAYASKAYCSVQEKSLGKFAEVIFAGIADETDITGYWRKNEWSITSAEPYVDQWSNIIGRHAGSIDPENFTIAATSGHYELFKHAVIPTSDCGGDTAQLRINYNPGDARFIGHAWCLISKQSQCPEEYPPPEPLVEPGIGQQSQQDAGPPPGEVRTNSIGMDLVWIPPGGFKMGSTLRLSGERPVHDVKITKGFWMGRTEVTQGQYNTVMGS